MRTLLNTKFRVKQQGAALIMALFVVTLVAIIATLMMERLQYDLHRMQLFANATKKKLYADGSIAWAKEQLNSNWTHKESQKPIDKLPLTSPLALQDTVKVVSRIDDMQGLFNINNLTSPIWQKIFMRLLQRVSPKIDAKLAEKIMLAVLDWISGSDDYSLQDYYLKLQPSYRAPHQLMASVSELRLVKGITQELYRALLPYVTALPEATKININSAPKIIFMALNENMRAETARALLAYQKQKPFVHVQDFMQLDIIKNNTINEETITVSSQFFLVRTSVTVNRQRTLWYTLLHRQIKDDHPYETIVWQSKGTL